jgi:hypothetical protein
MLDRRCNIGDRPRFGTPRQRARHGPKCPAKSGFRESPHPAVAGAIPRKPLPVHGKFRASPSGSGPSAGSASAISASFYFAKRAPSRTSSLKPPKAAKIIPARCHVRMNSRLQTDAIAAYPLKMPSGGRGRPGGLPTIHRWLTPQVSDAIDVHMGVNTRSHTCLQSRVFGKPRPQLHGADPSATNARMRVLRCYSYQPVCKVLMLQVQRRQICLW